MCVFFRRGGGDAFPDGQAASQGPGSQPGAGTRTQAARQGGKQPTQGTSQGTRPRRPRQEGPRKPGSRPKQPAQETRSQDPGNEAVQGNDPGGQEGTGQPGQGPSQKKTKTQIGIDKSVRAKSVLEGTGTRAKLNRN